MGKHELERAEEETLLRQFVAARKAGDVEQMRMAVSIFVQGRHGQLLAIALMKMQRRPEADAEDVVGETIISVLQSFEDGRSRFEGSQPGELAAWTIRILKRRIADYFRREERQIKTESLDAERRDEEGGVIAAREPRALTADPAAEVPIHDAHERIVNQLSPAHRRVVEIWWVERLPASQIVERLREEGADGVGGVRTVDNVHQIISRYRAKMRRALEVTG